MLDHPRPGCVNMVGHWDVLRVVRNVERPIITRWSCARTRTSSWTGCLEEPGSAGVAPELGPARVVPEPGSGSAPSAPVLSEGRSSVDARVPGVTPPLLKRHRTREQSGSGSVDGPGEGPAAASTPEVIDVEMQDDPSIPYENIADTEMDPGFFEGEAPMEVEQGVGEGNEAVGMDLGDDLPRMGDLFDEAFPRVSHPQIPLEWEVPMYRLDHPP